MKNKDKRNPNKADYKHIGDGWYVSPKTNYVPVNKEGEVLLSDGTVTRGKVYNGYLNVSLKGTGFAVHRLMVLTFLDQHPDKPIVNHKDGNKLNNQLDNLEWCDYTDNIVHAFKTGLRPDNHKVEFKDLETGEIKSFYSLQESARYFGLNASAILQYLRSKRVNPFKLKWDVRYENGEWAGFGKEDIRTFIEGFFREVVSVDVETKEVERWRGLSSVAEHYGVSHGLVGMYIRRKLKNNVFHGKELFYRDEFLKNHPDLEDIVMSLPLKGREVARGRKDKEFAGKKPRKVEVVDLEFKTTKIYDSLKEFVKTIENAPFHGIKKSVTLRGRWNKYLINYL